MTDLCCARCGSTRIQPDTVTAALGGLMLGLCWECRDRKNLTVRGSYNMPLGPLTTEDEWVARSSKAPKERPMRVAWWKDLPPDEQPKGAHQAPRQRGLT